jgi:excisionase family DNA binding protein
MGMVHDKFGDRLLTIKQVAQITGLAVGTLYHLASERRIPVVALSRRCIRFHPQQLDDWLDRLTISQEQKPSKKLR